ncbi:MAG: hypothetical protein OEV64_13060 [Desulfobulbaceae bacterium]|nr:hypothetical protein [Desulfobulbaceae bacterium]
MTHLIEYLRDHLKIVIGCCYGVLGLIIFLAFYVDNHHAHTVAEQKIPFFWSLFGFIAAGVIIRVAGWYGKSGIQTSEDYYDR